MSINLLTRHSIYLHRYWFLNESLIDIAKVNDVYFSFDMSTLSVCIGNKRGTYARCVANGHVVTIKDKTDKIDLFLKNARLTKFDLSPLPFNIISQIGGTIMKRKRIYRSHTKDRRYIFTVLYFFIKINDLVDIDVVIFIKKDRYTKQKWFFALPIYMNII